MPCNLSHPHLSHAEYASVIDDTDEDLVSKVACESDRFGVVLSLAAHYALLADIRLNEAFPCFVEAYQQAHLKRQRIEERGMAPSMEIMKAVNAIVGRRK